MSASRGGRTGAGTRSSRSTPRSKSIAAPSVSTTWHPSSGLLTPSWPKEHSGGAGRSMGMRPIGTADELERRRRRAVELMQQGESPPVIARILGVGRTSLYRWLALARQSPEALAAKPHPGPAPRLTDPQVRELEGLLLE